ncbi:phage tail protein [Nodosilinea sp. LEGE 07088]|uniref:phage tail protein n=1 Tax=Nodosilinea sp. LEGE 07088 TaxID=2777968 RepID=UPI00187FDC66|nr:phage tail protein [Nodosilinea sp. LEGE 07088]MBE9141295.1 phage tail protein [Nodosilinea sp. LEGE 07088]
MALTTSIEFNYVTADRFYIEMEDTLTASFSECSGLGVQLKREAFMEGGVNDQQRILIGQPEFPDITLKRGITSSLTFWTWLNEILMGKTNRRRTINILLFNQAGETIQCWTLIGTIPVSWRAPALQADSNTVAIEELTLAYEGLQVSQSQSGGAQDMSKGRTPTGYFA